MPDEDAKPIAEPPIQGSIPILESSTSAPPSEPLTEASKSEGRQNNDRLSDSKDNGDQQADELSPKSSVETLKTETKPATQSVQQQEMKSSPTSDKRTREAAAQTNEEKERYGKMYKKTPLAAFSDPTKDFKPFIPHNLEFEEEQIEKWMGILAQERILILQSYDWRVLRAAATTIVNILKPPLIRELTFEGEDESQSNASLTDLFRNSYGEETLVLVWAHIGRASNFLASLPTDTTTSQSKLEERGKRVLTTVQSGAHFEGESGQRPCLVTLQYEEPHLKPRFPKTYKEMAKDIRRLRAEKRWGVNDDSALGLTVRLLEENAIEHELFERSKPSWRPDTKVQQGLQDRAPLENTIKFVGAYFTPSSEEGALSPDDFQRILLLLLADRAVEAETLVAQTNMPSQFIVRKRILAEDWQLDQQRLTRECGLTIEQSSMGPLTVRFLNLEYKAHLQREFQSGFYWAFDDLFQRCLAAGLLFDPVEIVRQKTAELLLIKLQANPTAYGRGLLQAILSAALVHPGNSGSSLSSVLATMNSRRMRAVRIGLYQVLYLLCDSSAPSGESLAKLAAENIEQLIELGCHGLAWHLANRLSNHPEYSKLYPRTLRRLLDESPGTLSDVPESLNESSMELRERTLRRFSEAQVPTPLLTAILNWFPPNDHMSTSRSNHFVLELTLRLCESAMYDDPTPPIVLTMFDEEPGRTTEFHRSLVHVILHPALATIITNEADEETQLWWILCLFLSPALHAVEDPPLWPHFAILRFRAKPIVIQAAPAARFQIVAILSWVRAALRAKKDPRPLVRHLWQVLPKRDRLISRDLLSAVDSVLLEALNMVGATPLSAHRTISRETLKSLRDAIRLTAGSFSSSSH